MVKLGWTVARTCGGSGGGSFFFAANDAGATRVHKVSPMTAHELGPDGRFDHDIADYCLAIWPAQGNGREFIP